eukprot:5673420-Prymnesium_polylepis.2
MHRSRPQHLPWNVERRGHACVSRAGGRAPPRAPGPRLIYSSPCPGERTQRAATLLPRTAPCLSRRRHQGAIALLKLAR